MAWLWYTDFSAGVLVNLALIMLGKLRHTLLLPGAHRNLWALMQPHRLAPHSFLQRPEKENGYGREFCRYILQRKEEQ